MQTASVDRKWSRGRFTGTSGPPQLTASAIDSRHSISQLHTLPLLGLPPPFIPLDGFPAIFPKLRYPPHLPLDRTHAHLPTSQITPAPRIKGPRGFLPRIGRRGRPHLPLSSINYWDGAKGPFKSIVARRGRGAVLRGGTHGRWWLISPELFLCSSTCIRLYLLRRAGLLTASLIVSSSQYGMHARGVRDLIAFCELAPRATRRDPAISPPATPTPRRAIHCLLAVHCCSSLLDFPSISSTGSRSPPAPHTSSLPQADQARAIRQDGSHGGSAA
jgi:hypothetical protein